MKFRKPWPADRRQSEPFVSTLELGIALNQHNVGNAQARHRSLVLNLSGMLGGNCGDPLKCVLRVRAPLTCIISPCYVRHRGEGREGHPCALCSAAAVLCKYKMISELSLAEVCLRTSSSRPMFCLFWVTSLVTFYIFALHSLDN